MNPLSKDKLEHILCYAKQQQAINLPCKVPPEDMVAIVEMALRKEREAAVPEYYVVVTSVGVWQAKYKTLAEAQDHIKPWLKGFSIKPIYTAPPAQPVAAPDLLIAELLEIAKNAADEADKCAFFEHNDESERHSKAIADWQLRAAMLTETISNSADIAIDEKSQVAAPVSTVVPDDYFSSLVSKARPAAEKAMRKFPQPNYVLLKVAEEAGEVVQAGVHYAERRMSWEQVEGEVVQLLAMLIRLVTEGDQINGVTPPAHIRAAMLQSFGNSEQLEPVIQPYKLRDGVAAIRNAGIAIDTGKIQAVRDALNSPAVPDGWQLVPIEPTEDMVIQGFESEPDEFFSKEEEWEVYQEMSGCEQAAHRAKLCWAAMLSAAPKQESE